MISLNVFFILLVVVTTLIAFDIQRSQDNRDQYVDDVIYPAGYTPPYRDYLING